MLSFLRRILLIPLAALLGNWLGSELRARMTGEPAQGLWFQYVDKDGTSYNNVPVATKFYPAVLLSLLGRPRWLLAFLGGLMTGAFVEDRHETAFHRWMSRPARPDPLEAEVQPEPAGPRD